MNTCRICKVEIEDGRSLCDSTTCKNKSANLKRLEKAYQEGYKAGLIDGRKSAGVQPQEPVETQPGEDNESLREELEQMRVRYNEMCDQFVPVRDRLVAVSARNTELLIENRMLKGAKA